MPMLIDRYNTIFFEKSHRVIYRIIFLSSFLWVATAAGAKEINVSLGEKFILHKGDRAYFRDINAELYLKGFTYSPCPKDVICVWSGIAVHYDFEINGKIYTSPHITPYDIEVGETDFKSYAEFTVRDPIEKCMEMKDQVDNEGRKLYKQSACWSLLAIRRSNADYCRRITRGKLRDACIENLLDQIDRPELCEEVETPMMFCKYGQAVLELNPDICSDVIRVDYKIRCYKEISEKTGEGIAMCDRLKTNRKSEIELCKDAIMGKVTH